MAELVIHDLRKTFGSVTAVDRFHVSVERGEFVSLVGPSGCGKTTILRMIAGLIEPDAGEIWLHGEDLIAVPVHKRNLGLVFQSYALFPHLTVFENVAFGLRRRGLPREEIKLRVGEALELVRLGALGERLPRQLSGGQQQRVALARALITEPKLLLLDEPLSNLDALLREEMRIELKRLQDELKVTTLFVTHDQAEALTMSDRVLVLNQGRLEQAGTPEEIYQSPASTFVASFVGRSNFLAGTIVGREPEQVMIRIGEGLTATCAPHPGPGSAERVRIALRHERPRLSKQASPGALNSFPGTVLFRAFAGARRQYVVQLHGGPEIQVEAPSTGPVFNRGETVFVEWAAEDGILLPMASA